MTRSVAIVIPAKDAADRIARCVAAVRSQTTPPDRVIVVDNGSTDGTGQVAAAAGAEVVREEKPGSYAARNRGLSIVDADIVAFTDDDCTPDERWIELLLAPFDDPAVAGAGGEVIADEVRTAAQRWAVERGLLSQQKHVTHPFRPFFATANAAYRRTALEAVGGFDDQLRSGGDVDLAWRVQAAGLGRLEYVPDAIVRHHHRDRVVDLLRQQRRYARGHAALDRRWRDDERYLKSIGTRTARLRPVWMLPARLPVHAIRRQSLALPVIDAAVQAIREVGRWEGARQLHAQEKQKVTSR